MLRLLSVCFNCLKQTLPFVFSSHSKNLCYFQLKLQCGLRFSPFSLGLQRPVRFGSAKVRGLFYFPNFRRKLFSVFRFSFSSDSLPVEAGCKGSKLFRLSKFGAKIFEDFRRYFQNASLPIVASLPKQQTEKVFVVLLFQTPLCYLGVQR